MRTLRALCSAGVSRRVFRGRGPCKTHGGGCHANSVQHARDGGKGRVEKGEGANKRRKKCEERTKKLNNNNKKLKERSKESEENNYRTKEGKEEEKKQRNKTEQLRTNVFTYTTKHKEQLNTIAFDREFSSSVRRQISTYLHPTKTLCRKRLCLTVLCVSSYMWVHFSGAVLFCQPHQQLFTHSKETKKEERKGKTENKHAN